MQPSYDRKQNRMEPSKQLNSFENLFGKVKEDAKVKQEVIIEGNRGFYFQFDGSLLLKNENPVLETTYSPGRQENSATDTLFNLQPWRLQYKTESPLLTNRLNNLTLNADFTALKNNDFLYNGHEIAEFLEKMRNEHKEILQKEQEKCTELKRKSEGTQVDYEKTIQEKNLILKNQMRRYEKRITDMKNEFEAQVCAHKTLLKEKSKVEKKSAEEKYNIDQLCERSKDELQRIKNMLEELQSNNMFEELQSNLKRDNTFNLYLQYESEKLQNACATEKEKFKSIKEIFKMKHASENNIMQMVISKIVEIQNSVSKYQTDFNKNKHEVANVNNTDDEAQNEFKFAQQLKSEELNTGKEPKDPEKSLTDLEKLEIEIRTLKFQTCNSTSRQLQILTNLKQSNPNSNLQIPALLNKIEELSVSVIKKNKQNEELKNKIEQLQRKHKETTQKVIRMIEEKDDETRSEAAEINKLDTKSLPTENKDIVVQLVTLVNEIEQLRIKNNKYKKEMMELKFSLQSTEDLEGESVTNSAKQPKSKESDKLLKGDKEEVPDI